MKIKIKKDGHTKRVSKARLDKHLNLGYEVVEEEKSNEEELNLQLEDFTVDELRELAKEEEIQGYYAMVKADLIEALEKVM